MNARQRNKVAMFKAVDKVFNTFNTEINSIPALGEQVNLFYATSGKIQEVYQIQQGLSNSNSALKVKEEAELIEATVEMAAALFVYAQINSMPDLQAKCAVTPSQLEKMPDEMLQAACLNIYREAEKLNGNLTDYGKGPEDITALKKEIDDFVNIVSAPRAAIVTRSQATTELDKLIKDCTNLLTDKIDKLMLLIQNKNLKVYNTYKAARVIVDLRKGKTIVEQE
ncbi:MULTISPECIES: hypothetical protein [unclassified Saccharicrinis]|uniref:hypothetical protein n=1 Tax=unclassified Saccharicrinis TaxID=2646859 RepID=UPI003D32D104